MTETELARKIGHPPQNLNNKIPELEKIAETLDAELKIQFIDKDRTADNLT